MGTAVCLMYESGGANKKREGCKNKPTSTNALSIKAHTHRLNEKSGQCISQSIAMTNTTCSTVTLTPSRRQQKTIWQTPDHPNGPPTRKSNRDYDKLYVALQSNCCEEFLMENGRPMCVCVCLRLWSHCYAYVIQRINHAFLHAVLFFCLLIWLFFCNCVNIRILWKSSWY